MIAKDDIVIRKAILHILDTNRGECILSNTLLDPGPDLHDFIRNHIYKIVSSDDTKNCEFDPEYSPIYSILETWDESDETSFIECFINFTFPLALATAYLFLKPCPSPKSKYPIQATIELIVSHMPYCSPLT